MKNGDIKAKNSSAAAIDPEESLLERATKLQGSKLPCMHGAGGSGLGLEVGCITPFLPRPGREIVSLVRGMN